VQEENKITEEVKKIIEPKIIEKEIQK